MSLTIVRYRKALVPFALLAMAVHRLPLRLQKGCTFWKLMGSGRKGTFDLNPDWQQWALLAVWNQQDDFERFYQSSFVSKWWQKLTTEQWTILCEPLQSHGKWDNKEPFKKPTETEGYGDPIAVLTRATIRFNRLKNFWANVDGVAQIMSDAPGYIMSVGIGEAPVYRQATFSIWQSVDDVKNFAYRSREHGEVIKKTRDENWYSEELFARFKILETRGTLHGADPLHGLIQNTNQQ
ncbi:uncharacterized protein DUF3291 [Mucilaginibacter yixingensis]|uniref:Uncharacterized protein DUF3291 n=1 Tax=Mucilaginibacter yixingensis TaxID=1295612 RepID=A0A2T5JA20_9SPHI|nr:DUF3291 domain-containing protein [Mucilaginibacter yixingensis]PTQ96859.1 uncharacterized protein DUF3291 [Mucilaginibacter yixingensis]